MYWRVYCISLYLILGQFTGGGSLRLNLETNSPSAQRGQVIFFHVNATARINCTVEVDTPEEEGDYSVAMYYNNAPIDHHEVINGTLEIGSIDFSDGGWYTCATSSNTQRLELDFLVVVGGAPRVDDGGALTRILYRVQRGERVEFPCFPQGTPYPEVKWFHESRGQIIDGDEDNLFRIDPTSKSLVIFNATEDLLQGTFYCNATNDFGSQIVEYDAGISETPLPSTLPPPKSNFTGSDLTLVTVNQFDDTATLECADGYQGNIDNISFSWFANEDLQQFPADQHTVVISRQRNGSEFYCCQIVNTAIPVEYNVHCATVVFRSRTEFIKPTPPNNIKYHLPPGRRAALLCHGATAISPRVQRKRHYDPPNLSWSSRDVSDDNIDMKFSDEHGLAYAMVSVDSSGSYICSGDNFVDSLERRVDLVYVDIDHEIGSVVKNGLAESEENAWMSTGDDARITTYMNERVFMLSFSNSQSVENVWLSQEVTVPSEYPAFSIRGRLRHSTIDMEAVAVIQVLREDETPVVELPNPVRNSLAWQWVQRSVSTNGTTNYIIRLALKRDNAVSKRQSDGNGIVFFDDIDITPTGNEEPSDEPGSDNNLAYIIGGSVGGAILLLLVAIIVLVVLFCCCCRRGKDNALPMRKLTTLVKRFSTRHDYKDKRQMKMASPTPIEYEIPISSNPYSSPPQDQHRGGKTDEKNGQYTSLNPNSLDEPSYYTNTSTTFKTKGEGGGDVGGVDMYLEVIPPVPSHGGRSGSPRGSSPKGSLPLGLAAVKAKEETELSSPDILEGDTVDPMYEYVNADLGPA